MSIEDEIEVAAEALKRALRAAGKTYGDVSAHLGVSLPTVKRMLTRGEMPLGTFAKIAVFAGTSMGDLLADGRDAQRRMTYFTEAQDAAFAARPELLAYFSLLARGEEPRAIARAHGLKPASTVKYLKALEDLGLVAVAPHDRATLVGTPPFAFTADSLCLKRDLQARVRDTLDGIFARWKTGLPAGALLVVKGMSVTPARYGELTRELADVIVRHAVASERENRSSTDPRRTIMAIAAADAVEEEAPKLPAL
jgi:hypothetical protein